MYWSHFEQKKSSLQVSFKNQPYAEEPNALTKRQSLRQTHEKVQFLAN